MKAQLTPLSQFCNILQGGRHGLSGNDFVQEGFPAYGAGGLNGHLATFEFERQAVVLSAIGARCGKCFFAEGRWSSLANTQIIFPDEKLADPKFLWFQLNDEKRWHRSGTGQPFIKPSDVKAHKVFLPPLPEQRRIAAILDKADALRTKRREALAQLDRLTQAIFIEMFGDPGANPLNWARVQLGELLTAGPQNGLYKPASDYGIGSPILRIDAFYDGVVTKPNQLKRVRVSNKELQTWGLKENDIIVNRVNSREYLGKSALIPYLAEPTVFESNMMRLRLNTHQVLPCYVVQFLQTKFIRAQIATAAKDAVNQSSINQQDVKGFVVNVPPLSLQREFKNRWEKVAAMNARYRDSLETYEGFFTSLQHRAFRGEL